MSLVATALVAVMKWPVLRHLRSAVPEDLGDPLLQVWQLAWGAHAVVHQPRHLFDANTFFPLPRSLAFSDSLLGYAPLGALIGGGPQAAVVRYNLAFLLSYALASAGAYALARQLGCRPLAAGVAGVGFAYAPWHLAQEGHLQILSTGGIPLALALLARGHGYPRGPVRPGLVALGWAVAAWQVTLGFGLGLQFGYLLGVLAVAYGGRWLVTRAPLSRRLLTADLLGAAGFALVAAAFALPYLQVAAAHPEARRSLGEVGAYSPPLSGFFTSPGDSTVLGPVQDGVRAGLGWPPEMTLSPGLVLIGLALLGAAVAPWSRWRRLGLLAAAGALLALGMGTRLYDGRFTYRLLYEHAPGWEGIRTPGRLVVLLTLALALLAAGAVQRALSRLPRTGPVVACLALVLVLGEAVGHTPTPAVPALPVALDRPASSVLVLPTSSTFDDLPMYWSTAGLYPLVNGSSGFVPTELAALREQLVAFPDPKTVVLLEHLGIERVVLLPAYASGTPWEGAQDRPYAGLGLVRRQVGDAFVYEVTGASR